jgi:tetratricopeptide (TPR) repeat protein
MFDALLRKLRNASAPEARAPDASAESISRGNALLAQGKLPEALAAYRLAIAARPDNALAHLNTGYALQELARHGEAVASLERAAALDPAMTDAHYLLGKSLFAQGGFDRAAASFMTALQANASFAHAHADLARTQEQLGQPGAAAQSYERALACDAAFLPVVGLELARLHVDLQEWDAALAMLDRLDPAAPRWLMLRGIALDGLGRREEALDVLGQALQVDPAEPRALHARGNVLFVIQRYQAAVADYEGVLAVQPEVVEALSNCGAAYERLGERHKAIALIERALHLRPDDASATHNLSACLLELLECRKAIESSDRGLAFHPQDADLHWDKAVAHLLLGELAQGWAESEWRWEATTIGPRSPRPAVACPLWTGDESLQGKTILLTAEQGLGDTLQLLRYVPRLVARGASVMLRVPRVLEPLLRDWMPGCHLVRDGGPLPATDFHCPLLSLPLAFATEVDTIPGGVPYLRSDPRLRDEWVCKLGTTGRRRVGMVWSGNPAHRNDANRSMPLRKLLAGLPRDGQLVSLQKELRDGDEQVLAEFGVLHFGDQLQSFAETAALVDAMDLVISVDTSVAHLAGALAKPLWLLIPYVPDWRWMLGRDDSPWYPTARLFRQDDRRQWDGVIARVAAELGSLH